MWCSGSASLYWHRVGGLRYKIKLRRHTFISILSFFLVRVCVCLWQAHIGLHIWQPYDKTYTLWCWEHFYIAHTSRWSHSGSFISNRAKIASSTFLTWLALFGNPFIKHKLKTLPMPRIVWSLIYSICFIIFTKSGLSWRNNISSKVQAVFITPQLSW